MRSDDSLEFAAPPWGKEHVWREVNAHIDELVQRYSAKLKSSSALAVAVRIQLTSVYGLLDALCLETCPRCPDPCCLNASPWFDFRDLVFLHLNTLSIPGSQPIDAISGICRYSGTNGCKLDRISRPWICTWYLCPVQTANLISRRPRQKENLDLAVKAIKMLRIQMENEFIRVIV